jgi:thioredoxin reductase
VATLKPPADCERFDVVIIGAGPAGLSAALILGRCCRSVLLCDRGTSRSWASKAMHGFLSRDGIQPAEFVRCALTELRRYQSVSHARVEVRAAAAAPGGFLVSAGPRTVRARKLLIATGLEDELPAIEGLAPLFGTSVFQCPYCDGWEHRQGAIAVHGLESRGFEMARALTAWSRDIVLFTDGSRLSAEQMTQIEAGGIRLVARKIRRLESVAGQLRHIVLDGGTRIARDVLFFDAPSHSQSDLARRLGCTFAADGGILCDRHEATAVPGVYAAGNIIRNVQLSIVAAAEGATAAFGINLALTREDFMKKGRKQRTFRGNTRPAGEATRESGLAPDEPTQQQDTPGRPKTASSRQQTMGNQESQIPEER